MRVTYFKDISEHHFSTSVNIDGMTFEEAEILYKSLNKIEEPKPFIRALLVNMKKKLFGSENK